MFQDNAATSHYVEKSHIQGQNQSPQNQSINLTGHPADNSIQSGMSDARQSSQCLGSVYHSCDSIRYFRSNSLTHTDDYLSVYDHNSCDYNDAAHGTINTVFATRTPPASNNKFKKRQGAKATKKLEQLESVGHELNPREATSFRALSARCNYLAQDRPDITHSAKEV